jgi:hypothetical protein
MHRVNILKAAVAFAAVIFAFIAAVPSAQAVGTYNRRLSSVTFAECMAASDSASYPVEVSPCQYLAARWKVHVKSDSYNGTGHEVWQIESAYYPGKCMIAGNSNNAQLTLGSCQYSGSVHNKFEVFKSVVGSSNNIYQLKDIEAFENNGQHRCIIDNSTTTWPLMGACNVAANPSSYWDAIAW